MQKIIAIDVGGQWAAIDVLKIIDVVRTPHTTPVPCSHAWVSGIQNLRGRLVTALDLCAWLDIKRDHQPYKMSIILQHRGDHYSLLADRVGDVFDIAPADIRENPRSLAVGWAELSDGVISLPGIGFVLMLSIDLLLTAMTKQAA
jgi:purine-binding chemotaxis protein CheW